MANKETEWKRSYNERAYDRLAITIPKGRKEDVATAARESGHTINSLINDLLMQFMGISRDDWKNAK